MSITIATARQVLAEYCENGIIPENFTAYTPAFEACNREWQEADDTDETVEFWADIVCGWADAQNDTRPVHVLTDAFGTAGGDDFDSLDALYRLVCQLAADNGGRWFEDDGLVEGRDFEYVSADDIDITTYADIPVFYMFPETGSVDTVAGWRASCDNAEDFNPEDFVEVCSINPPEMNGDSLSDCYPDGWIELRRISDIMDPEIRERVHDEWHLLRDRGYEMSDQAFLTRYRDLHRERFGEEFTPVED